MSETTNLKLFKHDEPLSTNQNQFDIDKALHQNWDKIDEYVGENTKNIQILQNQNTDLQQENVNLQQEKILLKSQIPNGQIVGENITLTDSSNLPYEKFNICGKSVQETRSGKNQLKGFKEGETSYFYSLIQSELADNFYFKATPVDDNWLKVECDRTGETTTEAKYINAFIGIDKLPNLKVSTDYTIIVEFRNVNITKISGGLSLARSSTNETASNAIFSLISYIDYSKIKNGAILKFLNPTESIFENQTVALRNFHATYTGDKFSYEMRISVVEGDYTNKDYVYEDYGISPSPEYPSEIKSVGDDGTVEIKQKGKNIFDKNKSIIKTGVERIILPTGIRAKMTLAGIYQYLGIELGGSELLGKEITVGATINPSANNEGLVNIRYGNSNGEVASSGILLEGVGTQSVTGKIADVFPDNCDRVYALLYGNKAGTGNIDDYVDYTDLMVVIGDTLGDYEEYKGNEYELQLSEPLRSLPNGVRDTIEEDGIHRRVKRVILKGTENIFINTTDNSSYISFTLKEYASITNKTDTLNIKSNMAKAQNGNIPNTIRISITSGNIVLFFDYNFCEYSNNGIKTKLTELYEAGTPLIIDFPLAEEIIEPYTDNPLLKATSYKNITNIFSTDEVSPVFDITYKKDLETLFNNLNSALVEGGM